MTIQQDRPNVRIFPPLIQILAIAFSFVVQWVIPVRILGISRRLTLFAGWVVILAAAWIITWTARSMFRAGIRPDPTRPGTVLVVDGPFRFTRNPMYLSWELVCVGVGLAANIWWPIIMAVPAAFVTRLVVINEEESYLERRFGAEYGDYKARVRRWV
jgi:protein-S-isoprenylcysteine O-methyltransferase Ste14